MPLSRKDVAGCTATYAVVGVGNASAAYLGGDPQRISLLIFPSSTVRASFRFGAAAVLDEGLTVQALGDNQLVDFTMIGTQITLAINAIASALGPTNIGSVRLVRPT